jgi:formylglycine-generating enzyme required for sulfatase activity
MNIIIFATEWGPRAGGVNVFSRELALALGAELGSEGRVVCILPASAHEISNESPGGDGVEKVAISHVRPRQSDQQQLDEIAAWLSTPGAPQLPITWIGHDVITGPLAVAAAAKLGGGSIVIHHMSYADYDLFKGNSSIGTDARVREQREVLRSAGMVAAVGPLLRRSASDLRGSEVLELVPGFASFPQAPAGASSAFTAITFGRMGAGDDRIKQGRLASAGFGLAIKKAGGSAGFERLLRPRPRLHVIGVQEGSSDEAALRGVAEEAAGRAVLVSALPYDIDRAQLLTRIKSADVAMMLSWHDGFGLSGWEAVAAGTPLILSKHTGLYELIERELSDAGVACIHAVDIEGRSAAEGENPFTRQDQETAANALLTLSLDPVRAKKNAQNLRQLLEQRLDCSWRGTARALLEATGGATGMIRTPACVGSAHSTFPTGFESRFEVSAWNAAPDRERRQLCRWVEENSGSGLRLQEFRTYSIEALEMKAVPTFLHTASGVELQLILGGTYTMGQVDWQREHDWCTSNYPDWVERWSTRTTPAHKRSIGAFLLSKYPILQEQWDRSKADLSLRDKRSVVSPRSPIDGVSWLDLHPFLKSFGFRLPSEAEWEWACGAGSPHRFFWGDEMDPTYCWHHHNSLGNLHIIDEHLQRPNMFGLIDMLGNVWEWCADDWIESYEGGNGDERPWISPRAVRHAAQRGGGWNNWPPTCRTRFRSHWAKEDRLNNTGFRVVMAIFPGR